jgi:hypothetical protein
MNVESWIDMVPLTMGSVTNGPQYCRRHRWHASGYFPGSPSGSVNALWDTTSVAAASGTAKPFRWPGIDPSTGAQQLLLPMQN